MKKAAYILIILAFLAPDKGAGASSLERGYEALAIYDYFKAKALFYKANRRQPDAYACYGLATIYHRTDNPFHNADSALRYLNLGWSAWQLKPVRRSFGPFVVSEPDYRRLADSISAVAFKKAQKEHTVEAYDGFLSRHFLAAPLLKEQAVQNRDQLELSEVRAINKSSATARFIFLHPGSPTLEEAGRLLERQVFEEYTRDRRPASYITFLKSFPSNRMAGEAYEWLYNHYSEKKDVAGLARFVQEFPQAPQNLEAWKLLFSLSAASYSYAELKRFLDQYPQFPLKNTILQELELNKQVLYPFVRGEAAGYINEEGVMKIPPGYDAAGDFRQGLAVVHRRDSAWYINKANDNPFGRVFLEAGPFNNGVAPVRTREGWFFMNRLGQVISDSFEEISDISDGVYVIRKNGRYGAVDAFAQQLIAPRFEKLGDFVNGFAYYTADGVYGFVSRDGAVHPAEFGWLSDFSTWRQAVIKVAGKFGIVDHAGRSVLEPVYDQVLRQNDSVYLVVKGDKYGFFHAEGCFVYFVAYDHLPGVQSGRFNNGPQFKLNRKDQQAVGDSNGHLLIPFGAFDEVNVEAGGLYRVRKRGRFGFADSTGRIRIQPRYDQAQDFENGAAIARLKGQTILINREGRHLHETPAELGRLGSHYFITAEVPSKIIDGKGSVLFTDAENVQQVAPGIFAFERAGGEIRLLYD